MSGSSDQQQPQAPAQPDLNAMIQALIQRQMAVASGQGQQVQLPPTPQAQTQYSNDPSQGPDLLARIGLAIGGGSLPGAPAELRQQMGKQALLNFGIGLLGAGRFSTPGEALAGGLRGAQSGLLGSEAAQAGQQEYALNSRAKLAELGLTQQKNQTEALTSILPLLQMQGRMGLPPLFGPGSSAAGGPGGGAGGGGGGPQFTGDPTKDLPMIAQRESGGDPTALNYVAKADPTAYARGATASGKYQMVNSTWQEAAKAAGIDTSQYPTAMSAPEALQDKAAQALYGKYGTAPWDASKFTSNWVAQPGGGYQLVKGAQPPAAGPGSAVGPYKVASNAPVAPPGGGLPSGGGKYQEVAPPPAAPSGGLPLPPQPPAEGVPVVGDTGLRRYPDGSVGTPGVQGRPAITPDQEPSARIAPAPDAQPTLGPVGPVTVPPVVAQPPSAQPPTSPPVSTQPPAAPAQPPALPVRPPDVTARNDDGTYTVPDEKISTPQFQSRYRQAPTPDELVSRGLVLPANVKAFQDRQTAVQTAEAEAAAAHAAANRGAVGYPGFDVDKAIQAANSADKNAQDARNTYNGMVQDAAKTNAGALQKFYTDQDTQLASAHKDILDRQAAVALETQREQAAAALETQRGEQAIRQAGVTSDVQAGQKALEAVNATREGAQDTINTLEMARNLSKQAGTSGFLQQWPQVANALVRNNLLTPDEVQQLGAQRGLDAVMNKVVLSMRAGSGISRMTNFDLQFLQNTAPSSFTPEQMRPAMFAAIQTAMSRQVQYADRVNELHASGMPVWQARQQADTDLGHMVKETPTVFPQGDPRAGQPMSVDDQNKWIIRNVTPGTFYVQPSGALGIRGEAKQQGQQ